MTLRLANELSDHSGRDCAGRLRFVGDGRGRD
jgi:hypothetical protein